MTFDWRRFVSIFILSGIASFITFLVVQFLQGEMDDLWRTATRAVIMGIGLALLFSIQRRKKDYPWMD
jgi:peptidoglycan/LPS O-acetylase OafA/YrhL